MTSTQLLLADDYNLQNDKLVEFIISAIQNPETLAAREVGLAAVTAIAKDVGCPAAPFLTPLLPVILTAYADKVVLTSGVYWEL